MSSKDVLLLLRPSELSMSTLLMVKSISKVQDLLEDLLKPDDKGCREDCRICLDPPESNFDDVDFTDFY